MTPKEKAKELYGAYAKEIFQSDLAPTINKTWELNDMWIVAKKCALIAVDEIQEAVRYLDDDSEDYWFEVKQEIEQL